jgi:hypothetical protein
MSAANDARHADLAQVLRRPVAHFQASMNVTLDGRRPAGANGSPFGARDLGAADGTGRHGRPSTLELRPSSPPSTATPPGIETASRHANFRAHWQMFVAD